MIYPTRRAVMVMGVGAPVALLAGVLTPAGWLAGPIWILAVFALIAIDAVRAGSRTGLSLDAPEPVRAAVGRPGVTGFIVRFASKGPAPQTVEAAASADARLGLTTASRQAKVEDRSAILTFPFTPERRGTAEFENLWVRWRGPLGLAWKQKIFSLNLPAPVLTDLQSVRDQAVRLFARDALFGAKTQIEMGEGSEFQSLRDYQAGMDRRAIDWKQSARHAALLAKEFRTERNHNVIMALDCGRAACEPVGGVPRIDRAINAALLLSYACLRSGDRAGLFAFDSAPRVTTGALGGLNAFRSLQAVAGRIDYSTHETNYTLALSTLSGQLQRRSLVVVFTDFTDSTAAELMIESLGRLLRRHLVLFVVMRDEELESLTAAEPQEPEDVARAVVAGSLLRERDVVVSRLRRMGAHIVDTPADRIGPEVINAYLDLKRRDLL
ncbi:DUF58 domain-containing protein [Brevundimonas nasdae]|uniref:DUF58 domain-containing protein n=1 Tax=Brevundimonas nasdae TaxID=172043 RepID=A0ABX8TNB8_9CAUL|nr:DUF58 domain-containing protein [Brevundimonas nasdae]QYC11578.1 DUF58 domain-containing protein [Brevundimonas nasdae]QYC14366.1 DUF58 domain-containing protein [Brevundimonas nasdae]